MSQCPRLSNSPPFGWLRMMASTAAFAALDRGAKELVLALGVSSLKVIVGILERKQ